MSTSSFNKTKGRQIRSQTELNNHLVFLKSSRLPPLFLLDHPSILPLSLPPSSSRGVSSFSGPWRWEGKATRVILKLYESTPYAQQCEDTSERWENVCVTM
uniref:Uncharacterized protein n=1 Tax=Anguilla anguilla TaxID=7936 RepID=A0A0E9WYG4_ANGAN